MPATQCQRCREKAIFENYPNSTTPIITIDLFRGNRSSGQFDIRFDGIITCSRDGHQGPIRVRDGVLDETMPTMPVAESSNLSSDVPAGVKQDVQEAERNHFSQSYKSAVAMCRRALQLAIEEMPGSPTRKTVGPLIDWAKTQDHPTKSPPEPLLSVRVAALAEGIKDYGDGGAHRPETFDAGTVSMVINITVQTVNEIFR